MGLLNDHGRDQLDAALPFLVVGALQRVGHDWVYTDQLKSTRSRRSLALAPFLTELLRRHLRAAPPSEFVFSSPHGEIIRYGNFRKRYWDPAVARSGLSPLTPHALRHTCVAMMIAEGANRSWCKDNSVTPICA